MALNGRLAIFLAWVIPGSLLMLGVGALIRQQVTPAMLDEPPLPHRYRVADDLHQPLAAVIAAAEHTTPPSPQPAAGAGSSGLEPPMTAASDAPGLDGIDERRCGRFGCLEVAAWIVTDPRGGQLAACEGDVDVLLNDALARVPRDSSVRIVIWRA